MMKIRNVICVIMCLIVIALLLWHSWRWRQEYESNCKNNNIEVSVYKLD